VLHLVGEHGTRASARLILWLLHLTLARALPVRVHGDWRVSESALGWIQIHTILVVFVFWSNGSQATNLNSQ